MADSIKIVGEIWPEMVTSVDVINFAWQRFSFFMGKWAEGASTHNDSDMREAAEGIRIIAVGMENFRRVKAQEWAAAEAANSKLGEKPK